MKKINRKGKINKKRLFLVVFIFVLFIFLLSRVFLGIKGYVASKKSLSLLLNLKKRLIEKSKGLLI